jgi:hypothetical protein
MIYILAVPKIKTGANLPCLNRGKFAPKFPAKNDTNKKEQICPLAKKNNSFSTVGRKLRLTVVGRSLAFLPGASPDRNLWV